MNTIAISFSMTGCIISALCLILGCIFSLKNKSSIQILLRYEISCFIIALISSLLAKNVAKPEVPLALGVFTIIFSFVGIYHSDKNNKKIENERLAKIEEDRERKRWEMQKNFSVIDQMDGHEFEWFVAKVLAKNGFKNVQVTKASGDYGVDIIAYNGEVKCAFQCKRYTGTLGLQPIQEVSAGARYYGASVAYVITNSYFSENARNLADRLGVILWDRNSLNYLINRINEFERKEKDGT